MVEEPERVVNEPTSKDGKASGRQTIRRLRLLWVVPLLFMYGPVGMFIESVNVSILGWPALALWSVLIVPGLTLGLFWYYGRIAIEVEEKALITDGGDSSTGKRD